MIELPDDIGRDDMYQWLDGGVFLVSVDEEWRPAVLVAAHEGAGPDRLVRVVLVGGNRRVDVEQRDIRAHWPVCGAINMDRFALYVQRLQRRQYRRTFNPRCVRVSVPGKWACLKALSAQELQVDMIDDDFLLELFNPTYPNDMGQALASLNERASIALNPALVLVRGPDPAVYYRGQAAGRIVGGEFRPECDERTARRIRKMAGGL